MISRRVCLGALAGAPALLAGRSALGKPADAGRPPVLIGLDGEFGYQSSSSAESILQGTQIAIEEINAAGGVLGGRPLDVVKRANHAVPARSVANLREFAATTDLVAVYCGRFSPVALENVAEVHRLKLPLLDPWAAADAIVDNGHAPNYVFRLSLRDSWAAPAMLNHLRRGGRKKVGLMMLNTSWGRSTKGFAEAHAEKLGGVNIADTQWINWDDKRDSMLSKYRSLLDAGADSLLLTANAEEAAVLCEAMLSLPAKQRVPVASHWGVMGGNLPKLVGSGFHSLDFAVVQTYAFIGDRSAAAGRVVAAHKRLFGSSGARSIASPTGVAHAYDLTHLLAKAVALAGTTDRSAIRDALERLPPHRGLIKHYAPAFSATRHEALDASLVFMARYAAGDGALERSR